MRYLLSTVLFLITSFSTYSQETKAGNIGQNTAAEKILLEAVETQAFTGVSAGFSKDGAIIWAAGAGFSDEKNNQDFNAQTLTRIASITKPMTAVAIMQLYEAGKIDLDLPIQTYLPDFPIKKEGAISVRNLLAHSSGIGAYKSGRERENKKNYASLSDASNIFSARNLIAVPGTAFNYTTYGYVVLGLIIEKVSGLTYEQYMKDNIWIKAGMNNTGIELFAENYPGKAMLYHKNSKRKIKKVAATNLSDRVPGGGVYSCATDMLKFGDAIIQNTLIKEATLKVMLEDPGLKKEGSGYGLGWYLYGKNPKYGMVYGHNGAQTGASTFLMILPEQKTAIIVLANTSGAMQKVSDISIQLFDISAKAKM